MTSYVQGFTRGPVITDCVSGYSKNVGWSARRVAMRRKRLSTIQTELGWRIGANRSSKEYLDHYRSHLVRLKTEEKFGLEEHESLPDDTTIIISNWRMKILACYLRENQARFFGKRSVCLIGFMNISNSEAENAKMKAAEKKRKNGATQQSAVTSA